MKQAQLGLNQLGFKTHRSGYPDEVHIQTIWLLPILVSPNVGLRRRVDLGEWYLLSSEFTSYYFKGGISFCHFD